MFALALSACIARVPVPTDLSAERGDPERGRYLGEHVANCLMCHSQRDWSKLYAPNTDGALGAGHDSTQRVEPFPEGTVLWTRNITSDPETGLGSWSDGEIARAVTAGLSRDGEPLFLNMPYDQFGKLARPDVEDLLAWVRTLPPVEREVPDRVLPFPLGLVVRTMPRAPELLDVAPAAGAARGAYLANAASCVWCHSPVDDNQVAIEAELLSGGHTWAMPGGGTVASANLTPDPTGLGGWSREAFVARFRSMQTLPDAPVPPGGFQTVMPWGPLAGLTDDDLGAIWDWLRTAPPRAKTVPKWTPAG